MRDEYLLLEKVALVPSYSSSDSMPRKRGLIDLSLRGREDLMMDELSRQLEGYYDKIFVSPKTDGNFQAVKEGNTPGQIMVVAHLDKFPIAAYEQEGGFIKGKMDDCIGIAAGIHAMKTLPENHPTYHFVGTVGHETENFRGARMLANEIRKGKYKGLSGIIVIDVSGSYEQAEFGEGPILYLSCQVPFEKRITHSIRDIASEVGVNLQAFHPMATNDSTVLASAGVPTACVEILAGNLHREVEYCAESDFSSLCRLVQALSKDLVTALNKNSKIRGYEQEPGFRQIEEDESEPGIKRV